MDSKDYIKRRIILLIVITLISIPVFFLGIQYLGKAAPTKANLVVNTRKITSPLFYNWQALAQGGEEQGVRMLGNVVPQLRDLSPRYIRLDHIYDYYNVVNRDASGRVAVNFNELDATVCDIYAAEQNHFLHWDTCRLFFLRMELWSEDRITGMNGVRSYKKQSNIIVVQVRYYVTVLCREINLLIFIMRCGMSRILSRLENGACTAGTKIIKRFTPTLRLAPRVQKIPVSFRLVGRGLPLRTGIGFNYFCAGPMKTKSV